MRLNAKILKNVENVNSWSYANQAYMQEGQENEVYIKLVDLDKSIKSSDEKSSAFPEFPIRYISQATVITASAIFDSLDDADIHTVGGIQPFTDDKSIFKFTLTADQIPSSGNLKIEVTEDGKKRTFTIPQGVSVALLNAGGC